MERTDQLMHDVVQEVEQLSAALFRDGEPQPYGMIRYHLGWADAGYQPARSDAGKRMRPAICLLACVASGGNADRAVPTAAAIELLHNFTLIHDDIQDRSLTRRHRATVWALWGDAQAINAGDALFAVSQLALLETATRGVAPETTLRIARELNQTALRIVEGQTLDLNFEGRWDITTEDYLAMIGRKTAAIVAFAAWSGALLGGGDAAAFAEFGRLLGLGFQVRDDALGIWGRADVTGKPTADDIRRRKKTFPIVALASAATPSDLATLHAIYAGAEVGESDVAVVLELLDRYGIPAVVQDTVDWYHAEARAALAAAAPPSTARDELAGLLDRLARRDF